MHYNFKVFLVFLRKNAKVLKLSIDQQLAIKFKKTRNKIKFPYENPNDLPIAHKIDSDNENNQMINPLKEFQIKLTKTMNVLN